jgi:predicted PurR-regulated permease PerM
MVVITAVVLAVWLLSDVVLVVFMAVLIAVMLRGAADWGAEQTGIAQRTMLALVSVLVVGLLAGFLYYLGPHLAAQSQALWGRLHETIDQLRHSYGDTAWGKALLSRHHKRCRRT